MPVIKSAKKKLRQDVKRTIIRAKTEATMKDAVKKAVAKPSTTTVSKASSLLDKAAKQHIIHSNKAARIKSRLAHMLNPKETKKNTTPVEKTKKVPSKRSPQKVTK